MLKNRSFGGVIANLFYSVAANVFSLVVSSIIVFIVPKLVGKTDYGYWQLYLFYTSYIGFFHFGWCDGVYLRYGGAYYEKLNYPCVGIQFWALSLMELSMSAVMLAIVAASPDLAYKSQVLRFAIYNFILIIPKTYLSYILQATNRIREYSVTTILEKAVSCGLMIAMLMTGSTSFAWLFAADVGGKVISLLYAVLACKELTFFPFKAEDIYPAWQDAKENLKAGVNLLVANLSGMLILGIMRMAIEKAWSVEVFGEVSLAISLSNLLMVFINAIGTVIFPMLKRMSTDKLTQTYHSLRNVLMLVLLAAMMVYYPIERFLAFWLPQYKVGISYMAILFPICIFESKMSLLAGPYLKALRMEKKLLHVNLLAVGMSLILTYLSVFWLKSLELSMVFVLILFVVRCMMCEQVLGKELELNVRRELLIEVLITVLFCTVSWFIPRVGWMIYLAAYVLYVYYKRDSVRTLLQAVKKKK